MAMKSDAIIALGVVAGIVVLTYKISEGLGEGLQSIGEGLGSGVDDLLGGAGGALRGAGSGIEGLGQGAGAGIAGLGIGVGSGVSYVGAGVYEIGKGTGYAVSGANVQDIIQTILSGGKEASTYQADSLPTAQNQPTALNQGNETASSFVRNQSSDDRIIGTVTNQFGGQSPLTQSGQVLPQTAVPTSLRSGGFSMTGNAVQSIVPTYQTQMPTSNPLVSIARNVNTVRSVANISPVSLFGNFLRRVF